MYISLLLSSIAEVRFLKICDYWAFHKYWHCFEDHWWTGNGNLKTFIIHNVFNNSSRKWSVKLRFQKTSLIVAYSLESHCTNQSHKDKYCKNPLFSVTNSYGHFVTRNCNFILSFICWVCNTYFECKCKKIQTVSSILH